MKRILCLNIKTKDPSFQKPGKLLDIGCGSGQFIVGKRNQGWDVYGVEPSSEAVEYGKNQLNLKIHNGFVIEAKYEDKKFDYIRLNHSFEHINNPNETLAEINRILNDEGHLFIGVPNIDSLNYKLFRENWWYLGAPVHTYNYSVKTLLQMCQKHGFKLVSLKYTGDYSGILGSIQIFLNRNTNKKSTEGFVINFKPFVVISHWLAIFLNKIKCGDAIELVLKK